MTLLNTDVLPVTSTARQLFSGSTAQRNAVTIHNPSTNTVPIFVLQQIHGAASPGTMSAALSTVELGVGSTLVAPWAKWDDLWVQTSSASASIYASELLTSAPPDLTILNPSSSASIGTVSVSNFPTSFNVGNFPASQVVQGYQGTFTDGSSTIATGGTAQTVFASNASRRYLLIQNTSSSNLWLNFTTTAVQAGPSILLLPYAIMTFEGNFVSTELVSIIGASTGQTFTAKQG